MVAVPYTFATTPGGSNIPLSQLDDNFTAATTAPGSTGQVIYNDGDAFTNAANLLYSPTTGISITDDLTVSSAALVSITSTNTTITSTNTTITSTLTTITGHVILEGVTSTGATGTGNIVFNNTPTLITPILGTPTSGTLTNCTGLPVSTGISGLGSGIATFLATPSSANLAAAVTDETGTGALVFADTPTFVTPLLGTPTSGTLTNCTGLPVSTGISGLGTNVATFLATPSSSNLAAAVTDETGTGSLVFANTPTLVTPLLGTPTSGTLTNCTGLPISTGVSGLGTGVATALGNNTNGANGVPVYSSDATLGIGGPSANDAWANFGAGTTTIAPFSLTSGVLLTSAVTGSFEYDGDNFYSTLNLNSGRGIIPSVRSYRLFATSAAVGPTVADYFGANTAIPIRPGGVYKIEVVMIFTKTTAGTLTVSLVNSSAPTSMNVASQLSAITGMTAPPGGAADLLGQAVNQTAATYSFTTGSLTTAVNHYVRLNVDLINGTGTSLNIRVTQSAGTLTPLIGSYWTCVRMPASNNGTYV